MAAGGGLSKSSIEFWADHGLEQLCESPDSGFMETATPSPPPGVTQRNLGDFRNYGGGGNGGGSLVLTSALDYINSHHLYNMDVASWLAAVALATCSIH